MSKSKIRKFFSLSAIDMYYFFVALHYSVFYWIFTRLLPYSVWKKALGKATKDETTPLKEQDKSKFRTALIAVNRCSRHLPFAQNCLIKALVTRKMLDIIGIRCNLCLGLNNKNRNILKAHAWIKIGDNLTIGKIEEDYTVVAMYTK